MPSPVKLQQDQAGSIWATAPGAPPRKVTEQQASLIASDEGAATAFIKSAGESLGQLGSAAVGLLGSSYDQQLANQALQQSRQTQEARGMGSPLATMAGQVAPDVAAGVATGMASVPGMLAMEGGIGALRSPENPLAGAALNAALAGVVPGGAAAFRAGRAALPEGGLGAVGRQFGIGPSGMGMVEGGAPGAAAVSRADRVASRIGSDIPGGGAPPGGEGRMLPGYLTAQELEQQGIPLTTGQRMMLEARTPQHLQTANARRFMEDLNQDVPLLGGNVRNIKAQQAGGMSQVIKQELGITGPEMMTNQVVGAGLRREGQAIGAMSEATGPVPFGPEARAQIQGIVDMADNTHQGALLKLQADIERASARGGNALEPKDFQQLHSRLGKLIQDSIGVEGASGKLADVGNIQAVLQTALEQALPEASRAMLQDLRYKYSILKTLGHNGVVSNVTNEVNPVSFMNRWNARKGQAAWSKAEDRLGRTSETMATLTAPVAHTGNTLVRVLGGLPAKATAGAGTAALMGAGLLAKSLITG